MIVGKSHSLRSADAYASLLRATPVLLCFLWLCFTSTLHVMPTLSVFWPPISLAIIFFCAAYAPRMMPYSMCLAFGLLHDIIAMQPLGLTALQYVAMRILMTTQGRLLTSLPFWMHWAVFSMAALLLLLIQWVVMGVHLSAVFPLYFATFPWLAVTALYPAIHRLLYPIYHHVMLHDKRKQGWS